MTTQQESYKTAAELGITADARQKLIDVIPVLLAEPADFDMADVLSCISAKARIGPLENTVLWHTLFQGQGECWGAQHRVAFLHHRTPIEAAAATISFLHGSETKPTCAKTSF